MAKNSSPSFSRNCYRYGKERIRVSSSSYFSKRLISSLDLHGGDIHEGLVSFLWFNSQSAGLTCGAIAASPLPCLAFPYVVGSISEMLYRCCCQSWNPAFWLNWVNVELKAGEVDHIQTAVFECPSFLWGSFRCGSTSWTWSFWRKCWSLLPVLMVCWYAGSGARRLKSKKPKSWEKIRTFFGEVKASFCWFGWHHIVSKSSSLANYSSNDPLPLLTFLAVSRMQCSMSSFPNNWEPTHWTCSRVKPGLLNTSFLRNPSVIHRQACCVSPIKSRQVQSWLLADISYAAGSWPPP